MKHFLAITVLMSLLVLVGCPKLESNARDTAAALGSVLSQAQAQYQLQCQTDKTQKVCTVINHGIDAQNLLITSVEAYCGWTAGQVPGDPNAKCIPVKSATQGLQSAVNNANQFITELKPLIQK